MDIFPEYLAHLICSFVATASFTLMFNCPAKELPFCGICGAISWMLYLLSVQILGDGYAVIAVLIGCVASSFYGRYLSYARKKPVTIYLIGSIIPLVPGTGIYYTMYALMEEDVSYALLKGIESFKVAGTIAIGIMIVLSMPPKLFSFLSRQSLIGSKNKLKRSANV